MIFPTTFEGAAPFRHFGFKRTKTGMCKKISANGINNIPIIMITVDTKEKTVLDAKNLGIKEYVIKPISPIALKKRICSVFGIKERA